MFYLHAMSSQLPVQIPWSAQVHHAAFPQVGEYEHSDEQDRSSNSADGTPGLLSSVGSAPSGAALLLLWLRRLIFNSLNCMRRA